MGHFGPKMAPPYNSRLALKVFNICTMNGVNSNCLGQMGHLGPRMAHPVSQLRIRCEVCFTIFHNESGQEIILIDFLKEIFFRAICSFGKKMVWRPHNFGSDLRFFYNFTQ